MSERVFWRFLTAVLTIALSLCVLFGPDDGPATSVQGQETASTVPTTVATGPPVYRQASAPLAALEAPTALAEAPAVPVVRNVCLSDPEYCNPPPTDAVPTPYGEKCSEWWDLAEAVGWPRSALSKMGAVMYRESKCSPGARNPVSCGGGNHALGLMQLCGWACPPAGCFDPASNLRRAAELFERSGWRPWCYHDNLTGADCG